MGSRGAGRLVNGRSPEDSAATANGSSWPLLKPPTAGAVTVKELQRIGELQAKVRGAHLQAHLAQLEILTSAQVAKYQELRGYTAAETHQGDHQHSH